MLNKFTKLNTGFTLLEVIIAIFIIAVGVGGVAKLVPSLIVGASVNQSRLIAAYLAQEGVEIVRNIRDTNLLEAHYGGSPVAWDDGFFTPPINCANGCEIDYLGVAAPPIINSYSGTKLKIDSTSGFYKYNCPGCPDTKFIRKITIEKDAVDPNNILIITVNISWDDRGKTYNFPVQEKLYKWY